MAPRDCGNCDDNGRRRSRRSGRSVRAFWARAEERQRLHRERLAQRQFHQRVRHYLDDLSRDFHHRMVNAYQEAYAGHDERRIFGRTRSNPRTAPYERRRPPDNVNYAPRADTELSEHAFSPSAPPASPTNTDPQPLTTEDDPPTQEAVASAPETEPMVLSTTAEPITSRASPDSRPAVDEMDMDSDADTIVLSSDDEEEVPSGAPPSIHPVARDQPPTVQPGFDPPPYPAFSGLYYIPLPGVNRDQPPTLIVNDPRVTELINSSTHHTLEFVPPQTTVIITEL